MEQNLTHSVAGREQHQPRRATSALERTLQQQLRAALAAGEHLDLQLVVSVRFRCHVRVTGVADGLLTGIMLVGFTDDLPRRCAGHAAIRLSCVTMAERIINAGLSV